MTHPNKSELEQFITGKLHAARLLEVDEHIGTCQECRDALTAIPAAKKTALDMGAMLLGAADCPEYEQLSAYVENELDQVQAAEITAHANLCELCARDISRIAELRSHAHLRPVVTVGPGMSENKPLRTATPIWRRVLAGSSAVALIVGFAFVFSSMITPTPSKPGSEVAGIEQPETHETPKSNQTDPVIVAEDKGQNNAPVAPVERTSEPPAVAANTDTHQTPAQALLKDGKYQVTERDGKMVLAQTGAGAPRTALEARIAAAINEKLKSGKVSQEKPVQLAMAELRVRNASPFQPSPLAPKLVSPAGRMVLSDRPVLSWSKVDNADSYKVTVYDNAGHEILTEVTENTSLTIADSLTRGEVYSWLVQVRFAESDQWSEVSTPASAPAKFGVLSAEDYASLRKLQKDAPGSHLALGVAYESFGLTEEAEREYAALRATNSGSKLADKLR